MGGAPMTVFTEQQKREFVERGFSRRNFGRIAAMFTAGAAMPFYNEPAMAQLSAIPEARLIYVCNPNNPTGSLTPRSDIEWLLENKPKGSVLMVDEAYTHIAGAPFCSDLVAKDKDIILLRTFSKIYGMAGLRAG